ncbi:hypothetical protein CBS63078_10936 [Aspergillus niger]|nr:hypothetical protein CBS63078_10936 [Aspergillus niger]
MTKTNSGSGQKFKCTARECSKIFESINDWRLHVNDYSFVKGYVCLYEDCGEFIPSCANEWRTPHYHFYLRHHIEPPRIQEVTKLYISRSYSSIGEGRTWCSACWEPLELRTSADVLDHFELHIGHGIALEIPGQTKYPHLFGQASGEQITTIARPENEGKDDDIDLISRGVTVEMPPS